MANNHQGCVEHGKRIIEEIGKICKEFPEFDFAFKFQYRNLDTFIHPDFQERMDIKNVKRFQETKLSRTQFEELIRTVKDNGFLSICTPFDEASVEVIAEEKFDYIKIASCSFTDWPLLEKISDTSLPVIASGAGSDNEDLHNVVNFFANRNIDFTLMHCIAEYPTLNEHLQLNQIDYYRRLFPNIRIGYSTHEEPDNYVPVKIAIAKGARVFEKHVGLPTENIILNAYSANPNQIRKWLLAAREAYIICGIENGRYISTEKERADLAALKRGVFVKHRVGKGHVLNQDDIFLAFPCVPGQMIASDLSKYNTIQVIGDGVDRNQALMREDVIINNTSKVVLEHVKAILNMLKDRNVIVPTGSSCELSHHYGIGKFREVGVAIISCVNREYCKKILVVLPGQDHPKHYHKKKEETFVVISGDLMIELDGVVKQLKKGDMLTVERGVEHKFSSETGCVFEEISTTHYMNDSFYEFEGEFCNPRKTKIHFTKEMLEIINGEKNI